MQAILIIFFLKSMVLLQQNIGEDFMVEPILKRNKKRETKNEPPQIVRTAQKGTYVGKYEVLSGEASRKRRLSSL